jgi:cell wall-associated NlpC family hydrolase
MGTSLHADYTLKQGHRTPSKIDEMPKNSVADMQKIPQDPSFYASQIKPFSKTQQEAFDKKFNQKYFRPWHAQNLEIPKKDLGWEVNFVSKKPIFRADSSIIPSSVYKQWINNADYSQLDSKKYTAITLKHTNVKALPTDDAFYRDPKKPGEGFPFDYNQNSSLHMNVPLYVSHFSKDKQWAFVRASYSFGWVRTADLALVNASFMQTFENGKYAMVIKDNLRLYDGNTALSIVKLGTIFPLSRDDKHYLASKRNAKGQASVEQVKVSDNTIIAKKPLPFTPSNVAMLAKEFFGEPYGWGGSYECRDCSATTRDFLGAFGIFIRRNSSKQAQDGKSVPIQGLPKTLKKQAIIKKADPFRSLLYVPGHIVLYLGKYKGEPVVMHTYWGVRKNDGTKLITGRTIITSTEPGKERSDVREGSKLINTLKSIILF